MDLIEPEFRPLYEKICIGNKPADAQWVFFEGMLIEPGLGEDKPWSGDLKSAWGHNDYCRKSVRLCHLSDVVRPSNLRPNEHSRRIARSFSTL